MRAYHSRAMELALKAHGVPPRRLAEIVSLYKRRSAKMKPINRNRAAVSQARARFASIIRGLFETERPKIAAQIASLIVRTAKDDSDRVQAILNELDFDGWVTLVIDGEKILVHIVVDGADLGVEQIGRKKLAPGITDQVNQAAADWARERSAELVGMKYAPDGSLIENPNAEWAITDSTRDLLRSDVADAIENGLSTAELSDKLAESYAFSDARAEMIARTEVAMADIQGSLIAYKASGLVVGKRWLLSDGHDAEDECDDGAAAGVVGLDDDFNGVGDPPVHPHCACDVLPVLAGEE